jgi:5-bromo-4-chloroindolyl phosphate hydrolysis protein
VKGGEPMNTQIIISIISLIGVIITGISTILTVSSKLAVSQAVQDEQMKSIKEQLKEVVVVSKEIPVMKYQMAEYDKRLKRLEEEK